MKNVRWSYLLITLFIMVLGLLSRKFGNYLPGFIAEYAGDTLWAAMIYFGVRFLFPTFNPYKSAILAISFCYFIEISQLYQAEWINNIRSNKYAALILGQGFLWSDILCYTVGVAISFISDRMYIRKIKRNS